MMGRSLTGTDAFGDTTPNGYTSEVPEHTVTVSPFYLDAFEVSVGRFRKFVAAYDGTPPAVGAGAHPVIAGSGWQASWPLPTSQAALLFELKDHAAPTWTDQPGANEEFAINLVDWYVAFAFCAWDGGRLPTEAEWEFVAAGGDQNRLYPWGQTAPSSTMANYMYDGAANTPFVKVGAYPLGRSRWGHYNLAGNLWEWVLDWYDAGWYQSGGASCVDCANLTPGTVRSYRGGCYFWPGNRLRAAHRDVGGDPTLYRSTIGFRCARDAE